MKCVLTADATIERVIFDIGARLNFDDDTTHLVTVEGHLTHGYVRTDDGKQPFRVQFHASKQECSALEALIEARVAQCLERYPKE